MQEDDLNISKKPVSPNSTFPMRIISSSGGSMVSRWRWMTISMLVLTPILFSGE
jgi:hypothetical protein